jgi:hypothetical protein
MLLKMALQDMNRKRLTLIQTTRKKKALSRIISMRLAYQAMEISPT